jgi:hypothetical protein
MGMNGNVDRFCFDPKRMNEPLAARRARCAALYDSTKKFYDLGYRDMTSKGLQKNNNNKKAKNHSTGPDATRPWLVLHVKA